MNIVQRNFFRLLRSGAFNMTEQVEPMSVYKWKQLYQLAIVHDVSDYIYKGLKDCRDQFYLHLTDEQWQLWEKTYQDMKNKPHDDEEEENIFLRADHLTNPLLNRKLQNILDDEQSDIHPRQLLLAVIRTSRHILNEGVPIKQLVLLGQKLRTEGNRTDFFTLEKWLKSLKLQQMAMLEGSLLTTLFNFKTDDFPIMDENKYKAVKQVAQELIGLVSNRTDDFYFSQSDGNIFVHTSNGSAMLGRIRRSARYFRYFPSETVTNFFVSFAHSLTHIEE